MKPSVRRFRVHYRDPDPACPIFTWDCNAVDKSHARDKFLDSNPDDDDWEIVKVEQLKTL